MVKLKRITEDWTSVLLGFLIIGIALIGITFSPPEFKWQNINDLTESVLTAQNFFKILMLFILVFFVSILAVLLLGKPLKPIIYGFPVVFAITIVALIIAGNGFLKDWNLEAVIISLSIGLIISNFFSVPEWLKESFSTELFVKIGLILLGTTIIFGDILKSGSLGLIQSLIVVISVWYFAFWVCRKLGIDEEMSLMISSAVSICGVSAAIATSGAIKGDPKKLSYVISIVLISAIPMIIFMPMLANAMGLSEVVTGAWLGGTIDTTGAVIASGSLVGEEALKISTIVKFSQNVLLGLAAFAISVYWTYRSKDVVNENQEKPSLGQIWERFPKFVVGFILASLFFSFLLPEESVKNVKDELKSIQSLWFALAFTTIGLETKFSDLFNKESKKPLYAFVIAQLFNVLITLVVAYFLFR
jgi:uncharacterized integral membrane protein (TIGR00698 family)